MTNQGQKPGLFQLVLRCTVYKVIKGVHGLPDCTGSQQQRCTRFPEARLCTDGMVRFKRGLVPVEGYVQLARGGGPRADHGVHPRQLSGVQLATGPADGRARRLVDRQVTLATVQTCVKKNPNCDVTLNMLCLYHGLYIRHLP